jgi:hypothetical protein
LSRPKAYEELKSRSPENLTRCFDDFPLGDFSLFTFETPEAYIFEENLDRSSIMTCGSRPFTLGIFLPRFSGFTLESSKEPKTGSPKVNPYHPSFGTSGDKSVTSTIFLREVSKN